MKIIVSFLLLLTFCCCGESQLPKPKGYLRLEYPNPSYHTIESDCPYQFEINEEASFATRNKCWGKIRYKKMKATVFLSYIPVENNLDSLLFDAYKLPSKHIVRADEIPEKVFINKKNKVYGTLFTVVGQAASQAQFFLTDSTKHFLLGSLYFNNRPNYDSILPATHYIQKDLEHLMESLRWKEE